MSRPSFAPLTPDVFARDQARRAEAEAAIARREAALAAAEAGLEASEDANGRLQAELDRLEPAGPEADGQTPGEDTLSGRSRRE